MASGVHIHEPVLDTLRREDENEKSMDQASFITLSNIPLEGIIGSRHTPIEHPVTLETDFEVNDSVKGNEGRASTIEGEKFLKSPSVAEVHFEENNLAPDACRVTKNAEKVATEHETDASHIGEAILDAGESNGLEKSLVSALEVAAKRKVGHDESVPVHEAGLPENKEDSESTIPEKAAVHMDSLNVNPEDTKTRVTVNDTESTSSVEEKGTASSTSPDIPGEKIEQTTFDTSQEAPENTSTIVPNEETEQNLNIKLDDSQMKTDENLEEEDEKPESTLIPEGKIKDEESQNGLFETKNETETVIQKGEEVIEKGVESSPIAASEAEDIEPSTSDHDTKASALENQILIENPQEIEVHKSECKPEKETTEEQVITETTTRDASHDETTPVDKAKIEDEEPGKSDLLENKEDAESTILVEEPIVEKHLEFSNAAPDNIKACDLVQDTETESSIKEKLPPPTQQEIQGDKIEQTSLDTKEETPEDISANVSNEETEQNSVVEVPSTTEALRTDNETEEKIKDENQREKDLLENNDTETELLKQEVTEKPVESLQLASVAEDTKASTLDHETEISALENQIQNENPLENVADETESKPCDVVDTKKETLDVQDVSTIESKDNSEENLVIEEEKSEKPLLRDGSTRDAAGDESTYMHENKNEGEDQTKADLFENPNSAESLSLIEDNTIPKLVESPQVDAEDVKTHVLDQDAETACLISASEGKSNDGVSAVKYDVKTEDDQKRDQLCDNEENPESNVQEAAQIETLIESLQETLPSTVPEGFMDDKTDEKTVDAIQKDKEILDNISTIVPNEETEQNLSIELDDLLTKTDENVGKEDEKPESILISDGEIKNEESAQNELFETKNETETVIQKSEEVIEKGVESMPASEAEDIEASTSDHNTETNALENQIPTEYPLEIKVDKSNCKQEKETLEEQVKNVSTSASMTSEASQIKHEAHLEKEGEKPSFTEVSTTDAGHDETTPVDKAMNEDEEPSKSDLFENKEDTEGTILVEEPILESHSESMNAIHDDNKACDLVQDTETKSSIEEKLPTATPQEIWGDKTEQTAFDAKKETREDISTNVSNDETEQNSIEVQFVTEALTTDNETEVKIKDEDQREKDLLENINDTESELLKQEVTEKPIESLQLASVAEDTKASTLDHETEISAREILTENPQEIMADETESKPSDVVDTKKETLDIQDVSTTETNDDNEENLAIEEDEPEKPLLREESTRDAAGDESTYTHEDKNENEDQRRADLFENPNSAESLSLIEDSTIPRLVESPQVNAGDIKTQVLDQDAETTGLISASEGKSNDGESAVKYEVKTEDDDQKEDRLCDNEENPESDVLLEAAQIETPIESLQETLPSTVPEGFMDDKTEEKTVDAIQKDKEILDNISTIVPNEETEQNLSIKLDDSQMKTDENLGKEDENPESTLIPEGKIKDEESMQNEVLDANNETETVIQQGEEVIERRIESSPTAASEAEDIEASTPDHEKETSALENQIPTENPKEIEVEKSESEVKYEFKTEDDDKKEDQLCDNEDNPEQIETPIEVLQETLPSTVPQGFLDDEEEEKTVDATHEDKEILDMQSVTKRVSNEHIEQISNEQIEQMDGSPTQHEESLEKEHEIPSLVETVGDDSLLQGDGSQIQCKESSEEESEMTSIIEASPKNINDDNPVNVHEESSEHEEVRKDEFGDTEITSQEEEAQVETPAKSSNIAAEDVIASDSCQETETKSSQEERTLNEEETVCEQIEAETLDTADTKMHTLEAQDVSTIVPNDNSPENSATEENDLQMKNEKTFVKETEKPSVTEASMTDASGDNSANTCEDKVEGEEQRGAELFEDKKDMESKLSKEEEIPVRLVESPQIDTEDIKTYVSDEGAEKTGTVEASEVGAGNDESAVENEVETEDTDKREDELSDNEKNPESGELLEAAQPEKPIESLQETLPSTVPRGFLDDDTEGKIVDALPKDEDVQNVTTTVPNERIEENSLIQMDGSQIQHDKYLDKEHEIPSVIEPSTKHANDDELIVHENNVEHEDPRKVEFESEIDTEINSQVDEAQIETHIKSSQVAAKDIIAPDSYQGTETIDSQEERILNEKEIVHEETEVERLDAAGTKKETPMTPDVSIFALNDDNEEHLVIGEDDSDMKNEENLGKESENPSSIEASPMDASSDESTKKCEDKIEGEEQTRAEDTECTLLKEAETAARHLESPQVNAEDIKTYVSDQGTETTGLVEVFEEVIDDNQPEVKCTIKTEGKDQKQDELCHNEKTPDSTLHLEVAETEKPFESLKEALPTSVPRVFLDEKTEEKISDATEKGEETREIQNVTSIVSNENIEDDSLLQVDGSQMLCEECSEEKSERTPIIEASTKNVNDDNSINVHEDSIEHEDLRKDESFETKEDTKITSLKEEAQVETGVKSLKIAAEDIIESDSSQETETLSSQEERILNEEEIVREQIEVETLDTDDTKMETPEAQDNSTIVPNDDSEANSTTVESDLQMKSEENFGKESGKLSVIEASTADASGDEPTNKGEDKVESEEQTGAEMFVDKKDTEEEIMEKLVELPHIDTENIKTYVSDKGAETTGVVEAFEGDTKDDKSAVKYEVKTEDNDQKEDNLRDDEKNPESGVLLEATQVEKPIESLQETPPSTVPREFVDDKTEEKTMDEIEKDMEILDIQNVAETMSNEKIEDNSLIQADGSPIQHEEYLVKEIEIPSVIEASTKHADADKLTSIHEDNIEHEDLRKVELLESNKDTDINLQKDEVQMETSPVKSLLVAAEDIIASDSYHGIETTSQEEQLLNENEIVHEQTEVERLDTADSDKETPEAQNIKENSRIPEDGSEQIHEELLEKESKTPPLSDTLTTEANDEVPEVIHQDKNEGEKLEKIDKFECDKHEEITLLDKAPAEKLNESSKEDLEGIKDIVSGANVMERSLIEVQSLKENPREIVGDHMDENVVDKDPEEIEDELLDKDVKLANEKHTEIGFIKEEEPVEKLQEPEKKDLEEVKAFVSHEGTETSSIEEQDLTEISQESVGDLLEDKKLAKAQEIPDFTPIVSGEHTEKNSSIQPDGSQTKHEELSEKECEMLSTSETSFLHSSNNESMTVDEENLENEHSNIVDKFEDEKHTKIAIINDQAPVEEPQKSSRRDNEEVKAFVSWEGAETSSAETQGLTEISPEIMGDKLEEKILDKVGTKQEFTKFISDQNAEDISLMPVDDLQIKQEELLEREIEASPLSETSLRNSNFNESTILHQDKIEDENLNRVDKFESEKHAEISLIKEEAPLEKLNDSPLRKDLEEIKAFDSSEDKETSSTGERNLTAVPQENDFTTVDASQTRHEELLERESKAPPLPLLHSSDGKFAIVLPDKIEDEELEKVDKFEGIESGEATLLDEEASAEKLTQSSEDLEGIKESITCDGTEITSSTEKKNLTTISQESVDDQEEEKVLNIAGETSDCTTVIPDNNNTERNLSVEVDASQMKHEEHLEEESGMPSLLMSNTNTEEPTIVHENKIMEHAEIILSNEEAFENSSKEENENVRASVLCEDTETSSQEQENLKENSREIVGDQVKDKITDIAQNAPDLTTITSDENSDEGSLIPLDGSQIKHEEPLEKESGKPSMSILDTTIENSTIPQGHVTDDQDPRKVDELEHEKDTEATLLKEPTPAEKVTESAKDDLEDTKVLLSCEDKEITSSVEKQSQKANQQEIVVDQTQGNVIDSANEALDFIQTVSRENAGENSLIQVEESNVNHEIVIDQTQENVLETAPNEQDFKPVISHDNAEENSLLQVDESQMKHDELEKESETPSLLILDTSNEESKTIYEDKTEVENLKKVHDFECGKREQITSTEEETQVAKVNESLKEDLEDIKALVSGEGSETTSFEEKQTSKENPREILSDQQEEKILDIAPEAQDLIKVVSSENVENNSIIQEDGSPMVHEEISEKEGETPSLSAALTLDTTSEDSTVIHEDKIENEDTREVDIFECEKHLDGKTPDAAPETPESKIVLDENTEEKSSNQVDKSQTKHDELLEEKSKTVSLSEISLLNTNNEYSLTVSDNKIEDEDPEKVDKLESEKHTEFPLTKEEPGEVDNNPLQEDNEEIKEFVSCLDTETTSSPEDQSLQINPQEVMENQMVENIIDTTPEPQNLTTLVSDENTKDNLSLDDDESPIKHEELLENESEKPSLSIPKTSNEEPSFICGSNTENEDVKRDEKVEQLNDFPEGPEIIEVSVLSENLETTSPIEERSLTENPQENITKDKLVGVVPEALESKTTVSDKNIEETSFMLEDGSQMKREENLEKESEMPSVSENSIPNTRNEEPTLFLGEKIEDEDQAKVNKSECEKHAEITEVPMENLNSSNLESTEAFVSSEDIEPKNSTEEQSLTVNPIENMDGQTVEKALDKALEARDFTPVVPDDNNDDIPSIQVDGSQMKHEEPLEKESDVLSSLETSLPNPNNEETETIHKDKIEDETLENVDEFESKKYSEIKFKEEAQVEESTVYKDIKANDPYEDTEASARQEQILAANPQDILGNQSEDNVIDAADSKEKITEQNLPVSNENVVKDSLIHIDESEIKHEENLEKEPYLEETSTVEANNESSTSHEEDVIEEESGKIVESILLNVGSPAYEADESLQVVSENIEAPVSCQKTDTTSSNINADPQEIAGDQTDDKINTDGTREITLEAVNLTTLDSNENEVLDSITPQDGLEIEHKETSMLADSEEPIIVHEDTIEGEDLKKVDTFESAPQTKNALLKEKAHEDEYMDSLQVASEPVKASVSCQDRDKTSSLQEQILTRTQQIVSDQVEEKLADTAKTREETPEASSSVLEFQEDEANRIGVDDINNVMIKDEETVNISNAAGNDDICFSDKVQAKEEEIEIISKTEIDEEADKDDTWIKLTDDETNETSMEEKEIDFSSHDKDTFEISRHDGVEDIPKGNENSTDKNEFLEVGYSNGSTESTTPIVNEDAEKIDKDITAETIITETGAASSALPITGVRCGPEETAIEDSKAKDTETTLAAEDREYQGQHTKLHESPPHLSHVKDSESEMAREQGRDNLQSGDDTNDDIQELDEGSVAESNEENFLETNSNEKIETEVTPGEKEASAIQRDPVSDFVVQEIQEQPGKNIEAVPEEKGIKSEQGEIKFDDSDDLKINSSTMVTDKVAPSDILCSSTSDAGERALGQETQIVVQEKEQKPGEGKAIEAVPEEKVINSEEDEIKEHDFNVLKENSRTEALDKITPVNILQGSTTAEVLRTTDEETPEQHGLDEASLKEIEGGSVSTTDKLTVIGADQIGDANFDNSVASNKTPVLQHEDSSESLQTEGEKQKTSEPEKGEKCGNKETAKLTEISESTEMDKPSLSGLLQEPVKEVLKVVDHSIDKKEPTTKEEELQAEKSAEVEHVEAKTDEEKDGEEESCEHQISDLSSEAPVMVDATDRDVKVTPKKSHNILSGVGSKVKHSISKVRKAITGKSSHPKSASPKYSEKI